MQAYVLYIYPHIYKQTIAELVLQLDSQNYYYMCEQLGQY